MHIIPLAKICQWVLAYSPNCKRHAAYCILAYGIRHGCVHECMCMCVCVFVRMNASLVDRTKTVRDKFAIFHQHTCD